MPQAAVDGISLFYERHGAGEPLLLIQGMSGTHLAWGDAFLAGLGDDLDVVAYDHRGVGESTAQTDPFTIVQLADDAAGLLDALGWDSAHVLGISMGGMVAQELALRHPQRIRTLTLGCTYPRRGAGAAGRPGAHPGAGRRAAVGRPRACAAHRLRRQPLGRPRRRRGQLGAVSGDGHRGARRGAGDHAADAGGHGP